MTQRPRAVLGAMGAGLAAAAALWVWWPGGDEVVAVAGDRANVEPGLPPAAAPGLRRRDSTAVPGPQTQAAPVAAAPSWSPPPAAPRAFAVPITVAVPQKLMVGEMSDLTVSIGANAGISEISFSLQSDTNVLQMRSGTDGDWTAGAGLDVRFAAEISGAEDLVRIHSAVSGRRAGTAGGSVAVVRVQAVAPGISPVTIGDVTIRDLAGRAVPVTVTASNLQTTVESPPP